MKPASTEKLSLKQIKQTLQDLHNQLPTETMEEYATRVWLSLPRIAYNDLPKSLQQTVREIYTPEKLLPFLLELNNADNRQELLQMLGLDIDIDKAIEKAVRSANYTIEQGDIQDPEYRVSTQVARPMLSKDGSPFPVLYAVQFMDAFRAVTDNARPAKSKPQEEEQQNIKILSRVPVLPLPTSPLTFLLARVLNAGGAPSRSRTNRHEQILYLYNTEQNAAQYTRKNKGKEQTVTVYDPQNTLKGGGKVIGKLFFFMLQRWEAGGYGRQFSFPLQDIVDLEMYSNLDTARKGIKTFMGRQALIQLSQQISVTKDGKKQKENVGGVVFYHHKITNNEVTIYVNDQMPFTLLANFFTMLPLFAFGLSINAFFIVQYIMYLARQNGDALQANNGKFTIKIDSVRQYLELPAPEAVKNFKYKEKIQEPIETAIEEIEEAIRKHHDALQEYSFTITPHYSEDGSIGTWLAGDLEIQLQPEYAKRFIQIAQKQEEHAREREKERKKAEEAAKAKGNADKKNP